MYLIIFQNFNNIGSHVDFILIFFVLSKKNFRYESYRIQCYQNYFYNTPHVILYIQKKQFTNYLVIFQFKQLQVILNPHFFFKKKKKATPL